MALVLKPLRCPYCKEPVDKRLLRQRGLLKPFLARKPFPCPHCDKSILFPEKADTLVSAGLFVAVILAPLFHFWELQLLDPRYLFALGAAIVAVGLITQKMVKA
ncbi:hypothetical protein FKG94_01725 [Exilibacterium tricleocarpae]|uniref:Uncharacterized protein n=1 Tax=Exilibacterium tricleocarpae TaxID=2591008 RepID=A0A545U9Z1_9GAMM|nr:hypothetical protein [Exilibacterium tricleocarpae]TQV86294.1 hypothetical protein FKG94_01725 [Exilibacterium tricleocarpae]